MITAADLLLVNANVLTMDPGRPRATGLVLADLGIDAWPVEVPGGRVATDGAGRPNGLLEERAQELVGRLVRPFPVAALADAIDRAGAQYLSEGITSCTEAGVAGGWIGQSPVEVAAYQTAREQGRLRIRVELMVASDVLHPVVAHAVDGLDLGLDLGCAPGSATTGCGWAL